LDTGGEVAGVGRTELLSTIALLSDVSI